MTRKIKFANEEEVKNNLILPFFQKLRFPPEEINFETKLEIQLGRGKEIIESTEERKKRGYLDILFKRNEDPLFVVETKNPNDSIAPNDIRQAISYARLLMAPFAIVTNGYDTKIHDTVTGASIEGEKIDESSYVKNGYQISLSEDIRYEAQRAFIGLNWENFAIFCLIQRDYRMRHLRGGADDREKKYIPEIHIIRDDEGSLAEFLKSEKTCFIVTGESGCGKTNFSCHIAQELAKKHPTLFLDGSKLAGPVEKELAEDFNWEFSSERTYIQIVNRVENMVSAHKKPLILVIDAIDELTAANVEKAIDGFMGRIKDKNIKVVMTCKEPELNRFLKIAGNPTEIKSAAFKPEGKEKQDYSYFLKRFTEDEVNEAIEKYQKVFNIKETLPEKIREECKLGFMLRVLFQVFSETGGKIPDDYTSKQLLAKYLEYKLEKLSAKEAAKNFLKSIAKLLHENNAIDIGLDTIREELKLRPADIIPEELFSHYLLQQIETGRGVKIRFYFDKLRDFIIAYQIAKLQEIDQNEFETKIESLKDNKVGWLALLFFAESEGNQYQKLVANYYEKKDRIYDFLRYASESGLLPEYKDKISALMKDNDEYFYLTRHLSSEVQELKQLDFIFQKIIDTESSTLIDSIFKKSLSEDNAAYIINFWENNFGKITDDDLSPYSLNVLKDIIGKYPKNTDKIYELIKRIINESQKEKEERLKLSQFIKREIDVETGILDKIAERFIKDNDEAKINDLLNFIFDSFTLMHDSERHPTETNGRVYEIVGRILDHDFEKMLPVIVSKIVDQFDSEYPGLYSGEELYGVTSGQWGSEFSVRDLAIVASVLHPSLREYYFSDKEKAWDFIRSEILGPKTDKEHPAFLKRAALPILLLRAKEEEFREEAINYLGKLIELKKGIRSINELIFSALSKEFKDYDSKMVLWLIKADLAGGGLPSNAFVVKLLFQLAEENEKEAKKIILNLLHNDEYLQSDDFHYSTLAHAQEMVEKDTGFAEEMVTLMLGNIDWINSQRLSGLAEIQGIIVKIVLKEWESGKEGCNNKGLEILKKALEKPITLDVLRMAFQSLPHLAEVEPFKTFEFIWPYIKEEEKLHEKLSDKDARQALTELAEALAKNRFTKNAIDLIDKLIDDPDPRIGESDDRFNYHEQIRKGINPQIITSVKGRICCALQHLALIPEVMSQTFDRVKKLSADPNLYVRYQSVVPLIELVMRRKVLKDEEYEKEIKELAFSMLEENKDYPVLVRQLSLVFDYIRDINEEKAAWVLERIGKTEAGTNLLIHFALYRKAIFPELPKFNPEAFEQKLKQEVSQGSDKMRGRLAWLFRQIIFENNEEYEKLYPYLSACVSEEKGYCPNARDSLKTIIDEHFQLDPAKNTELFIKVLIEERHFIKTKKDEEEFYHWADYQDILQNMPIRLLQKTRLSEKRDGITYFTNQT